MQANGNTITNDIDIEQLELYLDHELADAQVGQLDERLAREPALKLSLDALRGQRSQRLAAMSIAFDTDAASVERLVASVRVAQANEALERRRWWAMGPQTRSVFAAAACVAFGLLLGVTLQNRHSGSSGVIASPAMQSTGSFLGTEASLSGHGTYMVSVTGPDGREMMVRFASREQAQQFIESLNSRAANAKIMEQAY